MKPFFYAPNQKINRPPFKRIIFILIIGGIVLSFKPIVLALTRSEFKKQLAADSVSIKNVKFKGLKEIRFLDINIEKNGFFIFKASELIVALRPADNLPGSRLKVTVKASSLNVQYKSYITDFKLWKEDGKKKPLLLPELEILNLDLKIQSLDVKLNGKFSFDVDLARQKVNSLYVNILSLDYRKFHVQNAFLWVMRGNQRGEINISSLQYDKIKIAEIKSLARLEDDNLVCEDFSAKVLDGSIKGQSVVRLVMIPEYEMMLQFTDLAVSRFIQDFELENKFTMTGMLSGTMSVRGKGSNVSVLNGDFNLGPSGGTLTIKDKGFLETLASRTSLVYDTVAANLQDYHYNKGALKVFLEEDVLNAEINLDGEKGPRRLIVPYHFQTEKDGL